MLDVQVSKHNSGMKTCFFFFFTVLAVYIERTRVADGPIGKADKKLSVTGGAIMSSQGQDEDNIIIMF